MHRSNKGPLPEPAERIGGRFRELFGGEPCLVRSPGRVNLIGEHTDYNEGFVLPAAVDKAIYFAVGRRADDRGVLHALDLNRSHEFVLSRVEKSVEPWPNYLLGVVDQIRRAGFVMGGFNCVFGGDIPIAAGMSSSAAIEAGLAFALNEIFSLGIAPLSLVKLAQKAENEFVGVRCGIMDMFANIFGRARSVIKIDCRSLAYKYYPFEREDLRIVLCDTAVRRELASSEYNIRRRQCEKGVALLAKHDPGIRSLRDVTTDILKSYKTEFDPVVYRRCAYVIAENRRVEEACADLERNDFAAFGRRMNASHDGLRDEYEVSSRELDVLVDAAREVSGVLGARMMGAGFGGCTITLADVGAVDRLRETCVRAYKNRFGREPKFYISRLESGTEILEH